MYIVVSGEVELTVNTNKRGSISGGLGHAVMQYRKNNSSVSELETTTEPGSVDGVVAKVR